MRNIGGRKERGKVYRIYLVNKSELKEAIVNLKKKWSTVIIKDEVDPGVYAVWVRKVK